MPEFPHHYHASATAQTEGLISVQGAGLPQLNSAPPKEFGGPGDQWSPEDLLVGAIADCFVLSFRAIARMSKFSWNSLACEVSGKLDKVERSIEFTHFDIKAHLTVPADSDAGRAQRLLEKAKQSCFITNSLKSEAHLKTTIETA
jgi:peroxiredoxin-like protein